MKRKNGRILGIIFSILIVLFAVLLILPFAFQGKIFNAVKLQINKMLTAKVDFQNVQLSFIRHFPNASVSINGLKVIGEGDFAADTLVSADKIEAVVNLKSLLSGKGYDIQKINVVDPQIKLHVLADGRANWNIMKDTTEEKTDTAAMKFHLKLKDVFIQHANIAYLDEQSNMKAIISNLKHHTSGDLTADSSLLSTQTTIDSISFWMDGIPYLSKANAELNVDIDANINDMKFAFSKNSSRINAIPFSFEGWVKMLDEGFDMDIKLIADKVDLKSILSMIPAIYSNSFKDLKTGGEVSLNGFVKGQMKDENYPAFDVNLSINNGWFQYPSLPQSVKNIQLAFQIVNPGGSLDSTLIDLSKFSLTLGSNTFNAAAKIASIISDPDIRAKASGRIDLGMVKSFYPLEPGTNLNGLLDLDLNLNGKMSYLENNLYDKFEFQGKLLANNIFLKTSSLPQDISVNRAQVFFNNRYVNLSDFQLKIGKNDLQANGKLENFLAYALKNKTLKGQLNLQSNYLNVNDFLTETTETKNEKMELLVIPQNIDFTLQAFFKQLLYDKMNFSNIQGKLLVQNGEIKFQNLNLDAFGGTLLANGLYSTANVAKPYADINLNIKNVAFNQIFSQVASFQKFVPFFEKATGNFSTTLSLNTLLNNDMSLNLSSLKANGKFSTSSVALKDVPALSALASGLKKPELSNPSLKDLAVNFEISNGKLFTKPFDIKLGDIKMNLGGSMGLDQSLDFKGIVQLPDQLNAGRFSNFNVTIGGTYEKPKVKLDLLDTFNEALEETKAKIKEEVTTQVDAAKKEVVEKARKEREAALKEAQVQADKIRLEAKKAGDKLIEEATLKGNELVEKAANPIAKKVAEQSARKLVEEARKQADKLNADAEIQANKIIENASKNTNF